MTQRPAPEAALRLFCLHHAGGAASSFRGWQAQLGPRVQVVPVQLPGRETRVREPRPRTMDALVHELDQALDPFLSDSALQPYAFYGHSMGALIGYRLVRHRAAMGASLPSMLLVGAHPAPHRPHPLRGVPDVPQKELARWLSDIGGLSPQLLRHPEWLRWAVDLVRDDLTLTASHRVHAVGPVPCPIHVFAGSDDPLVPPAEASAWAEHSLSSCEVHTIRGGHFFTRDHGMTDFFDRLAGVLHKGAYLHNRSLLGRTPQ
ncbi:thioesterase II family protein [Streptomyces kanamyceticus]|uniref:thioesterase II family protein n=1 Tax=Streptomyces kanamyceticus TaxID=1967 RepID=UPI0012FE8075|nr:alpha/beta fold hydrolase [Streptomyces kanamyceticus]